MLANIIGIARTTTSKQASTKSSYSISRKLRRRGRVPAERVPGHKTAISHYSVIEYLQNKIMLSSVTQAMETQSLLCCV